MQGACAPLNETFPWKVSVPKWVRGRRTEDVVIKGIKARAGIGLSWPRHLD